ncbi:MAG: metal ABC transporter ATP-binding protein [Spirochaetes bacterium]|nr:metal ABC transporter ATP-binding protein [Spirochaetota bacterium]
MNGKIIVNNLSFSYGDNCVLKDINFSINENQIITIIGPNGGGKTTLLRLIAGLIVPDKGEVFINGMCPKCKYGHIGYVPQHSHFDNKYPITVFEVVLSGLIKPIGFYSKKDKLKAEAMIEYVGLESVRNNSFNNLSGGQSQRMLIARALVADADILLLDEPTSNIDSTNEKGLEDFLKNISKKMTILIVTHDTGFVSEITDRVFCINKYMVEHPIDSNLDEIISASYGIKTKVVRHDQVISSANDHICVRNND